MGKKSRMKREVREGISLPNVKVRNIEYSKIDNPIIDKFVQGARMLKKGLVVNLGMKMDRKSELVGGVAATTLEEIRMSMIAAFEATDAMFETADDYLTKLQVSIIDASYNFVKNNCTNAFIDNDGLLEFLRTTDITDNASVRDWFDTVERQEVIEEVPFSLDFLNKLEAHGFINTVEGMRKKKIDATGHEMRYFADCKIESKTFTIFIPNEPKSLIVNLNEVKALNDDDRFIRFTISWSTDFMDTCGVVYEFDDVKTIFRHDQAKEQFKFITNFLFYIRCFPECFIDGVPKDVSNGIVPKNPKITKISEKLVESDTIEANTAFRRPHFRKGHFKILRSEYYTKCRGKVIFVEATFVKGKAKTLID